MSDSFEASIKVNLLDEALEALNVPISERTPRQQLLKDTLLTQIGLSVMAQYADQKDDS